MTLSLCGKTVNAQSLNILTGELKMKKNWLKQELIKCGFEKDGETGFYLSHRGKFRNSRDKEGAEICGIRLRSEEWKQEYDEYFPLELTIFDNSGYEVIIRDI